MKVIKIAETRRNQDEVVYQPENVSFSKDYTITFTFKNNVRIVTTFDDIETRDKALGTIDEEFKAQRSFIDVDQIIANILGRK